jgi:hypothetical protein
MLTRDPANATAETVLAQGRARNAAHFNPGWRGLPELEMLEPELRLQVRRRARCAVSRNWLLHAGALGWVAAYVSAWYFLVPTDDQYSVLIVFALGAALPVPFFYSACMRRAIRKILRSMATSAPPGGLV